MNILADLEKSLKRKGLQAGIPYPATVVDNNDPAELQRVRARIEKFHDHLEDDELPWSLPSTSHPMGMVGGELGQTGACYIPVVDAKVSVYFPTGDPNISKYSTETPVDESTKLDAFSVNYPYRMGFVLPNGMSCIADTKTNELFIENPGDANITIMGDAHLNIVGNISAQARSSESTLPAYLKNAPERILRQLRPDPQKEIEFEGLHGGESGNIHLGADSHITFKAGEKIKMQSGSDTEFEVGGNLIEKVSRNVDIKAGSKYTMKASSNAKLQGSRIDLN